MQEKDLGQQYTTGSEIFVASANGESRYVVFQTYLVPAEFASLRDAKVGRRSDSGGRAPGAAPGARDSRSSK